MKKILHVIATMDPRSGGVSEDVRNSHDAFSRLGIRKEVVSLDDPEADFIRKSRVKSHPLGTARNPWSYHSGLIDWLVSNIPSYDLVIIEGLWLWPSIATWLAFRKIRKMGGIKTPPYMIKPHAMLDPWFQRDPSRRLKAIRNWLYWKILEHRVIRDAAALLFGCEEEKLLAQKTFRPYKPKREIVVGNSVPEPPVISLEMVEAFRKSCPNLHNGGPYILYMSRIDPKKGVDLLIKAYARVLD